jgi:hypothetical protein
MQCKSCKEDVSPKFAHALSVNVCPFCGSEILDAKLQEIIGELKIAFSDAKNYMNEIEDWLFSNYSLKKVKENEVLIDKNKLETLRIQASKFEHTSAGKGVSVHRSSENGENEVVIDENPTTVFAKRAGVSSHKKALDFIRGKSFGAADPSEFQGIDDEYGEMESDVDNTPLNSKDKNEMVNIFKQEDVSKIQELELQKLKRLQAQNAVSSGGGTGTFRRV